MPFSGPKLALPQSYAYYHWIGLVGNRRTVACSFLKSTPEVLRLGKGRVRRLMKPHSGIQRQRFLQLDPARDTQIRPFSEWRVRTMPQAADASRDMIWQGNCDVIDSTLCGHTASSNAVSSRITIAIEYPISTCPAKSGAASFSRLNPNRPGPRLILHSGGFCRAASD
jgi:hypothetical protein